MNNKPTVRLIPVSVHNKEMDRQTTYYRVSESELDTIGTFNTLISVLMVISSTFFAVGASLLLPAIFTPPESAAAIGWLRGIGTTAIAVSIVAAIWLFGVWRTQGGTVQWIKDTSSEPAK